MPDIRLDLVENLDTQVAQFPDVLVGAEDAANKIADLARNLAPVVDGDYKAGIQVQKTKAGYRVFASDQKSAWVEFGIPSRGILAQFVMRRAVEAAGFKFKKKRGR